MTADTPAFSVDLDKLEDLAARMRGYHAAVTDRLAELELKAREVEGVWVGTSAVAYREAHTEWVAGVTDMQEGLAALEAAVKTAHESYTAAAFETLRILGV
ncbi:WXG100 family type VII secretion target [Nocardia amikacinitolerans]|uniref:WXG100 family type VII secretion target n=1 Tax=Nocardia amikacinitolerans TaxID=756689 RepID=UPI0020A32FA4|nr:WXG100 family type VII secretion target [Nocardia amikacinitolerans]MCP2292292.1 WXG100 family type VII secretion target [Nocardia amikacinitolerans]